ncbi:hypothetical protein [Croceicoccus mobilis]|uniref:Uncharacterized protein n=1 Tax=Croceicoccus mobilis TaxID=1703339 RepID=A0A916Z398_9SPHN|nr:hypothetical protein [Croceicoccus mobilis]GGD73990.1 hypothetical protein GCM10010990_24510 [Croceicoccus mobilis]
MSTDRDDSRGEKTVMDASLREAQQLVRDAAAEEEQLSMLDPVTPDELAASAEVLGRSAGPLAVARHAREQREKRGRGRPKGTPNRRNDDFRNFLLAHGRHPALVMMEIASSQPEALMEISRNLDPEKRKMTFGEAQALRVRCAEGLLPYVESKKPVAVDMSIDGDFVLAVPGLNVNPQDEGGLLGGDEVLIGDWSEVDGNEWPDRGDEAADADGEPTP